MINAKQEFIEHVGNKKIKCADIQYQHWFTDPETKVQLKVNHDISDYVDFIARLNFEYDNSYGSQVLFGTIWYEDGTWASRGEYDGSEWWEDNVCPDIPDELKPLQIK